MFQLGLQSALLREHGFAHGFFGRRGGVSPAPWESLNFIASSGDDPARVRENLRRAGEFLGVPGQAIYFLSQVHGTDAVRLQGNEDRDEVVRIEGDATFSLNERLACGVRSADCGTVLIGDLESGAALAIHAGWKGAVGGVVPRSVDKLREAIGGPGKLVAAIGPMIEKCCFEIGDDVAKEIADASSLGERVIDRSGAKPHADLRAVLADQLSDLGAATDRIDQVAGCTVCDAERFFSYRRDGKISGRMLAAIVPRKGAESP